MQCSRCCVTTTDFTITDFTITDLFVTHGLCALWFLYVSRVHELLHQVSNVFVLEWTLRMWAVSYLVHDHQLLRIWFFVMPFRSYRNIFNNFG
mmetsp:Transcript_121446/g.211080  ORF Transcript_121446/g.211080 Transcript_121446/m.211080 type:complete len:93 (+) Transcript_121446:551-829(+)